MRTCLTLPALTLSLTVITAVPGGTLASRSGVIATTATATYAPRSIPATAAMSHAGASVPTPHAASDWNGLPARTYANLTKKILGDPIAIEGTQRAIIAAFVTIGWRQVEHEHGSVARQ